jgi:hypothetical protein
MVVVWTVQVLLKDPILKVVQLLTMNKHVTTPCMAAVVTMSVLLMGLIKLDVWNVSDSEHYVLCQKRLVRVGTTALSGSLTQHWGVVHELGTVDVI